MYKLYKKYSTTYKYYYSILGLYVCSQLRASHSCTSRTLNTLNYQEIGKDGINEWSTGRGCEFEAKTEQLQKKKRKGVAAETSDEGGWPESCCLRFVGFPKQLHRKGQSGHGAFQLDASIPTLSPSTLYSGLLTKISVWSEFCFYFGEGGMNFYWSVHWEVLIQQPTQFQCRRENFQFFFKF